MLNKIKTRLGVFDDSRNKLIEELIDDCTEDFRHLTHNDEVPEHIIIAMVVWKFSLLGAEGMSNENHGGIDVTYSHPYPDDIQKSINSYRKIRVL